jgi:hypothetical protein
MSIHLDLSALASIAVSVKAGMTVFEYHQVEESCLAAPGLLHNDIAIDSFPTL